MSGNRRWGMLLLGLLLSAGALYFVLRDVDWAALGHTLLTVDPLRLFVGALFIALGIGLRGWRWKVIAQQTGVSPLTFARAVNLGIVGNQLLPGRVGELVRVFALMRLAPTGIAVALGSAVLDRAVDIVVLLLSAWVLSMTMANGVIPRQWLVAMGVLALILVVGLALGGSREFAAWFAAWSARWLRRWPIRHESFLATFNAMTHGLCRRAPAISLLLAAVSVWLADYLAVTAALACVGLDLPPEVPLLLWVSLAAGSALPSAPGFVGIYQLAAVWSLSTYGVPAFQAVAVAFVLQGVTLLVSLAAAGRELTRVLKSGAGERLQNP